MGGGWWASFTCSNQAGESERDSHQSNQHHSHESHKPNTIDLYTINTTEINLFTSGIYFWSMYFVDSTHKHFCTTVMASAAAASSTAAASSSSSSSSSSVRAEADRIKEEGNRCFARGKFAAAADKYTEAIVSTSTLHHQHEEVLVLLVCATLTQAMKPVCCTTCEHLLHKSSTGIQQGMSALRLLLLSIATHSS